MMRPPRILSFLLLLVAPVYGQADDFTHFGPPRDEVR
jgi:hypothetical protein